MTAIQLVINGVPPRAAVHRRRRGIGRLLAVLKVWHERAEQRRQLRAIPAHLFKDIGADPQDVRREMNKPFWRV